MKATALASLLAAAHALDCETDNSPFAESRFVDDKGTTCPPGKYLCGDTSEHAYCFGDYKEKMADWKHPSHYPFEWVADQDDSEVNIDGNCIFCTSPSAEPKLDDMEARRGIVEQEVQTEKQAVEAKPVHNMEKDMREREARKAAREAEASAAAEQNSRDAQKEADDFSVREAARKVAEADLAAEKAAKVADKKATQEAEERMAYAKAAKEVQQADAKEMGAETVIGADVNASHPYKDGTYNDLSVDESPQQVAERKHAEKAAAWKKEQADRAEEEKARKKEETDMAAEETAKVVHEEKAAAWRAEKEAAAEASAAAVHAEKVAAWKAEHHVRQKEADQLASAKTRLDEPTATEPDREAPEIGPHSTARAERKADQLAKKAAKKAKKSFYITNDPFFVVNGKKGHFWLPAGAPAKLLSVPFPDATHSVALLGETFGDGEASQWFKTYTLAVNGEHIVKVRTGPSAQCPTPIARCPMPICPMPDAQCPTPNAQCPMPNAPYRRPIPDAHCPMRNARCPMPVGRGRRQAWRAHAHHEGVHQRPRAERAARRRAPRGIQRDGERERFAHQEDRQRECGGGRHPHARGELHDLDAAGEQVRRG
jgi:hypothetical protein